LGERVRVLRAGTLPPPASRPVLYWMQRDQRVRDNWALLHAASLARAARAPLVVVFCLLTAAPPLATARSTGFQLRGLAEVEADLCALRIPFRLLLGGAGAQVGGYAAGVQAGAVVTDFSPLREARACKEEVARALAPGVALLEVDAHNVVPAWVISDHAEVGARTLRPKVHAGVWKFATPFPAPAAPEGAALKASAEAFAAEWKGGDGNGGGGGGGGSGGVVFAPSREGRVDWAATVLFLGAGVDWGVPEVGWCPPGERAAGAALRDFLAARIKRFDELRNDPNEPLAVSNLSPYLNFGHLSAQRVLLETMRATGIGLRGLFPQGERKGGPASFVEELIVRRELSDNYCLYNASTYGTLAGAAKWAQDTLALHATDKREKVYTEAQFEAGATHEGLWNAMQMELVHRGKLAVRCVPPPLRRAPLTLSPLIAPPRVAGLGAHVLGEKDPGVERVPRRGTAPGASLQRQVLPGRARPQRVCGLRVGRVRRARHGLDGAPRVWQDPLHEPRLHAEKV
jgi:deoxyribodipyrimidine photo-lyase